MALYIEEKLSVIISWCSYDSVTILCESGHTLNFTHLCSTAKFIAITASCPILTCIHSYEEKNNKIT